MKIVRNRLLSQIDDQVQGAIGIHEGLPKRDGAVLLVGPAAGLRVAFSLKHISDPVAAKMWVPIQVMELMWEQVRRDLNA